MCKAKCKSFGAPPTPSAHLQELGNPVCEGGKSPSVKGALDVLLTKLAESLEEMEYSIE